jgi:hypothetical protein
MGAHASLGENALALLFNRLTAVGAIHCLNSTGTSKGDKLKIKKILIAIPVRLSYTVRMKNLNTHVEAVWSAETQEDKIKALTQLINDSHATKKTKILSLQKIVHLSNEKLDSFAVNYSMSGTGLKVI